MTQNTYVVINQWQDSLALPPELLAHIASFMPPNDVACSLRLVNKDAANLLQRYAIVRLSQPVPVWAFTQRWGSPGACRPLTPAQRGQLVCLTAAAGDTTNLKTAVKAIGLQPSPEVMAAAAAGSNLYVYRWLVEHERASKGADGEAGECGKAWDGAMRAARGVRWVVRRLCELACLRTAVR